MLIGILVDHTHTNIPICQVRRQATASFLLKAGLEICLL
jgi:hypothetical protein